MNREELLKNAKPILFNTEMVQAITEGRKTVTRRVIKPQPIFAQIYEYKGKVLYECVNRTWCYKNHVSPDAWNEIDWIIQFAPYQVGDIFYVRETWCYHKTGNWYGYRADGDYRDLDLRWKPSIHMPKAAARIFLKVSSVRVERLQDIRCDCEVNEVALEGVSIDADEVTYIDLKDEFKGLWDSTIKKQDLYKYGWDTNPFVWVIEFERVEVGNE